MKAFFQNFRKNKNTAEISNDFVKWYKNMSCKSKCFEHYFWNGKKAMEAFLWQILQSNWEKAKAFVLAQNRDFTDVMKKYNFGIFVLYEQQNYFNTIFVGRSVTVYFKFTFYYEVQKRECFYNKYYNGFVKKRWKMVCCFSMSQCRDGKKIECWKKYNKWQNNRQRRKLRNGFIRKWKTV